MKRPELLLELPVNEKTAVLLTTDVSVRYYYGIEAAQGSALLVWKDGFSYFPSWSTEKKNGFSHLKKSLPTSVTHLETEISSMSIVDGKILQDCLSLKILISQDLEKRIYLQRRYKQPEEIQKIRQAQQITDRAFAASLNYIHAGMTDHQIRKIISDMLWNEGSQMTNFNHVLGCGVDTVNPHVRPTGRVVQNGDLIMIDIGALVDGYGSDMTRMVAVGEPDDEKKEIYQLVLEAQTAGIAAVKPGAICCEVDRAAREVIEKAGYGSYFPHGLGHPMGCGGWEGPRFNQEDHSVLHPNLVMTVEPGIYLPGKFGIRIEDMVLITENGTENLTSSSHELVII